MPRPAAARSLKTAAISMAASASARPLAKSPSSVRTYPRVLSTLARTTDPLGQRSSAWSSQYSASRSRPEIRQ